MTNITATSDMVSRKVIITGGAGGAGHMVTQRWLERGASVLVVDAGRP
jgi:NAD(P)-dependent dehydrogenase (short-subunit alcohol dehydrogenase family)